MLTVILPDGSQRQYEDSVTPAEVATDIGPGLAKSALASQLDGATVGLDYRLPQQGEVQLSILTKKNKEALAVMRHSCAHVMARAVLRLFEGVQPGIRSDD